MKTSLASVLIATLVVALGSCSSKPPPYPADPIIIEQSIAPTARYELKPGDVIAVKFYNTPQLNENNVVVRPDGAISLPFAGEVRVAGRTAAEVEAELARRYGPELAKPKGGETLVAVIVRRLGSNQVHVGGEVEKDGRLPIYGSLTLLEAIERAGGFSDTADPERVVLIRADETGRRTGFVVDLEPVISGEAPENDVILQPTDIVFVPRSTIANLNLVVEQYIRKMLPIEPGFAIAAP
jgi:protein involved in polysaccharide export with SLBB domain